MLREAAALLSHPLTLVSLGLLAGLAVAILAGVLVLRGLARRVLDRLLRG